MNKLVLPRADMDTIVQCIRELMNQGWYLGALYQDINNQLDEQEY